MYKHTLFFQQHAKTHCSQSLGCSNASLVAIGAGYILIEDCLNLYDKNAIAVFDGPNKKAFLKRDCVIFVKFMFEPRITN